MSTIESPSGSTDAWSLVGSLLVDKPNQTSYQILDVLGYGTYGCIYLARTLSRSPDVSPDFKAIKCLSKHGLTPAQLLIQRQEIDIHLSLSSVQKGQHPNIVDMSAVIETKDSLYLVMEYCSGGDLYDAITSQHAAAADSGMGFVTKPSGRYLNVHSDTSVLDAMEQIISALIHAHRHQVFHRDLKPENILVAGDGSLKLADFGLATRDRVSSDFGCGSSFYIAPEQQPSSLPASAGGRRPYLPSKSDVWSLGIIFLNLRFGRNPWKMSRASADPTFAAYVQNPKVLDGMFPELSASALHFLHRVLCVDPNERADCFEALELLHRIDSIVRKDTSMEECDESRAFHESSSSVFSSSSTSSSDDALSSKSSMADSPIMSLNGTSTSTTSSSSSLHHDDIFHMEDDFGAKNMQLRWSLTSSAKSWSDMADEDEMDFSQPIEFEQQQQQQQPVDFLSHVGFPKLTDLVSAMTASSATAPVEVA
ncbi:hypothetical protein BX616_003854 [Lobosporangium transversale]|uniref:Kinase-like domain-containing protein n=1 Tax=Lobosporangium transversale TaxID=64571 RepID=A0A1Y2G5U2_9FUNG|nr:kinase-like domain-containing protein [Lobosporangium transversale]KAF9898578.1 hypothetical protein BX616_003854 [Lobosporangium transversale]ORY96030.1 kinase-like domain-containing protein [Lobosporangium transversale]|eukprot:XP_021875462.1 kinase-like domain-containing protein [Lobosporangium transversale]